MTALTSVLILFIAVIGEFTVPCVALVPRMTALRDMVAPLVSATSSFEKEAQAAVDEEARQAQEEKFREIAKLNQMKADQTARLNAKAQQLQILKEKQEQQELEDARDRVAEEYERRMLIEQVTRAQQRVKEQFPVVLLSENESTTPLIQPPSQVAKPYAAKAKAIEEEKERAELIKCILDVQTRLAEKMLEEEQNAGQISTPPDNGPSAPKVLTKETAATKERFAKDIEAGQTPLPAKQSKTNDEILTPASSVKKKAGSAETLKPEDLHFFTTTDSKGTKSSSESTAEDIDDPGARPDGPLDDSRLYIGMNASVSRRKQARP